MDESLTDRRDSYVDTLTIPCTVWRDGVDTFGARTGDKDLKVGDTLCGISSSGGGSSNQLVNSIVVALTVKKPGARVLSFRWDDDIQTGDEVRIGSDNFRQGVYYRPDPTKGDAKYSLGQLNNDDPARIGLQVNGEMDRPN